MVAAQVVVDIALNDRKERLVGTCLTRAERIKMREAALQLERRALVGLLGHRAI